MMKKKHLIERSLDRFLPSRPDELESGKVVAIFLGRGCITGVVKEVDKRKSLVRFVDGKEAWTENSKLRIVQSKVWIAQTFRQLKDTFPTDKEIFDEVEKCQA
jgi:hypothetical protein